MRADWLLLALPALCAVLRLKTGRYLWNLGVTGGCLVLLALSADRAAHAPLIGAMALSLVGDWFMAHKEGKSFIYYLLGIAGFFLAHALYIAYAPPIGWGWAVFAVLAAGYAPYTVGRIWPAIAQAPMRAATLLYALISCCALAGALARGPLYALGILMIVVSDTMIAECDFAGRDGAQRFILPTYFACHLLVTAGALC